MNFQTIRPEQESEEKLSLQEIQEIVTQWQNAIVNGLESQEGTFPDACIVTCLTIHEKSDRM